LAAYLLDLVIASAFVFVAVYLIMEVLHATGTWAPAFEQAPWRSHKYLSKIAVTIAFFLATGPIYIVLCHASTWQATIGKRQLNIYVTGEDGKRISLARSLVRGVAFWRPLNGLSGTISIDFYPTSIPAPKLAKEPYIAHLIEKGHHKME
jgi:uncharacterized RDD family membrane protein YckC